MSDETETATDPRLAQAPAPEPVEAPEPVVEAEAPAPEPTEPEEVEAATETPAEPEAPKKPRKSVEDALKSRVQHLTKQLAASSDAHRTEIERERAERQALEALLGKPEGERTPQAPAPAGAPSERTFTAAEVAAEARRIAEQASFDTQADATYQEGIKKHGDNFKEAVDNLNAVGVMTNGFLEAAFATDAAPEVINFLGADPSEAARIANLPPIRMTAELTKIAAKLTTAKPAARVSSAPAPFTPVSGAVSPTIDLAKAAEGGNDMAAYAAARAKQGFAYAMTARQRAAAARER